MDIIYNIFSHIYNYRINSNLNMNYNFFIYLYFICMLKHEFRYKGGK